MLCKAREIFKNNLSIIWGSVFGGECLSLKGDLLQRSVWPRTSGGLEPRKSGWGIIFLNFFVRLVVFDTYLSKEALLVIRRNKNDAEKALSRPLRLQG